jgi:ethanolamine kinase
MTQDEIDADSILMRAYGNNTDILIDRDREATSHLVCAKNGLAPPLLARFRNGLLYRFIPGEVCTPKDLGTEQTWRAVARRLGQWHAKLPISAISTTEKALNGVNGNDAIIDRMPVPNIWTVMRKWIDALPQTTPKQQTRKSFLEKELERSFSDLDNQDGPGEHGFVFAHCDLLSANVIKTKDEHGVAFIDYEYSAPGPAAFDLANHFSEWTGYECDYNLIPTRPTRHAFLQEYLSAYYSQLGQPQPKSALQSLEKEVDRFRGMPGFYWGIWALIQATISQIDFNYAECKFDITLTLSSAANDITHRR